MLIEQIDAARLRFSPTLDEDRRGELGQYMTPGPIAEFMAQMFGPMPKCIRLLDAGAGMGALSVAFIYEACTRADKPCKIDITAFEIWPELADLLEQHLAAAAHMAGEAGVEVTYRVRREDYILASAEPMLNRDLFFTHAILNPPYGKLNTSSKWRRALRSLSIETVNFYSGFVAAAMMQMNIGGEIVAITPRSFCNGPYYEPFRKSLLRDFALERLHVFESRREAFQDDAVLQENVIFKIGRGKSQGDVILTTDGGYVRAVPVADIVRPDDQHAFIRLPIGEKDGLAERVQALPCSLAEIGVKVSTGRVVDFRAREHLRKEPAADTVPLIYPQHMKNGGIVWPIDKFKKNNALADCEGTVKLTTPAGTYVLTKRFSAKEEKRRLVASVYSGGRAGFENHLNYFHEAGAGLPNDLAAGLCAVLNSEAVDQYFRTFSGHTQVNATDLRNLRYPTRAQLKAIGATSDPAAAVETLFA
ncbi:Eco57I restriction-modification methylase domain-containing protein [Palleronia sp.]|uniref:Eco57I restriction-modification methylase domain-containing protein n=1 Tax=Palleronia sp. TaxID=1940284 RepID=UPI0035C84B70